jgi:hypothetical protein
LALLAPDREKIRPMPRRAVLVLGFVVLILLGQPLLLSIWHDQGGMAFAKGGEDNDDNDDDRGDDDSGDDNSGSGGSDDDDDDDDDDNSGSGGGGSGGGGDDNDDGSDDDGSDDGQGGSGNGNGGSDDGNSGSGGKSGSGSAGSSGGKSQNQATQRNDGNRALVFGEDIIRLDYTNGTAERILKGRYERLDRNGRVVERRRATPADQARLRALRETIANAGTQEGLKLAVVVNNRQEAVQITDSSGWSEVILQGGYSLTDPNGNVVTRRKATADDIARLRGAVGLR